MVGVKAAFLPQLLCVSTQNENNIESWNFCMIWWSSHLVFEAVCCVGWKKRKIFSQNIQCTHN